MSKERVKSERSDRFKLHLTATDLKVLDETSTNTKSQRSLRQSPTNNRFPVSDPNNLRFLATNLVLVTNGLIGIFLNMQLLSNPVLVYVFALPFSWFAYEWHRLHGIKLTRAFRPILNMSNVLATYQEFDPLYQKLYAEDKDRLYRYSCCGTPELNPELPRTADELSEQEKSPPKTAKSPSSISQKR